MHKGFCAAETDQRSAFLTQIKSIPFIRHFTDLLSDPLSYISTEKLTKSTDTDSKPRHWMGNVRVYLLPTENNRMARERERSRRNGQKVSPP